MVRQACSVLEREFALVVGELLLLACIHFSVLRCRILVSPFMITGYRMRHTILFVNVAGTATDIHHTNPVRNSLPFPLTSALTSRPSNSATYKLIIVLNTKKTLCPIKSLNSLLFHPGIHILNNLSRFLKNSLFSSTFFLPVASPSPADVFSALLLARRNEAAFCSAMALRMRFMSATKRVRYTARDMRVRFWR